MFQVCPNCKAYHERRTMHCESCSFIDVDVTLDQIERSVNLVREQNELHLRSQFPPTWIPHKRVLDIYCIGRWLNNELSSLSDERRQTLLWYFNRIVRSNDDPYAAAQETLQYVNKDLPKHYKRFYKQ